MQNPTNKRDVNNDGSVDPLDALIVINAINQRAEGEGPTSSQAVYMDVTGDDELSPLDVLMVINWLNGDSSGDVPFEVGEGEAESDGEGESFAISIDSESSRSPTSGGLDLHWASYAFDAPRESEKDGQRAANFATWQQMQMPLERFSNSTLALSGDTDAFGQLRRRSTDTCFAEELVIANEDQLADTLQILAADVFDVGESQNRLN